MEVALQEAQVRQFSPSTHFRSVTDILYICYFHHSDLHGDEYISRAILVVFHAIHHAEGEKQESLRYGIFVLLISTAFVFIHHCIIIHVIDSRRHRPTAALFISV